MPEPCALPRTWVMPDHPRIVPPPWGALPPPAYSEHPRSGWDLENAAPDLYVFFPRASGYEGFRAAFLRLTGPSGRTGASTGVDTWKQPRRRPP